MSTVFKNPFEVSDMYFMRLFCNCLNLAAIASTLLLVASACSTLRGSDQRSPANMLPSDNLKAARLIFEQIEQKIQTSETSSTYCELYQSGRCGNNSLSLYSEFLKAGIDKSSIRIIYLLADEEKGAILLPIRARHVPSQWWFHVFLTVEEVVFDLDSADSKSRSVEEHLANMFGVLPDIQNAKIAVLNPDDLDSPANISTWNEYPPSQAQVYKSLTEHFGESVLQESFTKDNDLAQGLVEHDRLDNWFLDPSWILGVFHEQFPEAPKESGSVQARLISTPDFDMPHNQYVRAIARYYKLRLPSGRHMALALFIQRDKYCAYDFKDWGEYKNYPSFYPFGELPYGEDRSCPEFLEDLKEYQNLPIMPEGYY